MPSVAIIDTSPETIELLQSVLEDDGFDVDTAYIVNFKRDPQQLAAFFATYHPQAVVYDIALPYEDNWRFLQQFVLPASGLASQQFVLTTTGKRVLERLMGATPALELVDKPFDISEIMRAVHRAVAFTRS